MLLGMRSPKVGPTPVGAWRASTSTLAQLAALATHSSTSLATMFDSTGKLTYAPNNLLTQSNTFSNAAWAKVGATITTGVLDRSGGTSASTLTATGAFANLYAFAATSSSHNVVQSIWIRRRTGTGKIWMKVASSGAFFEITGQVTSSWTQVSISGAANASSTPNFLQLDTSGDAVDISEAVVSAVTYETTPRTADQVITTSSAYYGPRIDYDPNTLAVKGLLIEEARTNLLIQSGNFSASWTALGAIRSTDGTLGPDGTTAMAKYTANATTGPHEFFTTSPVAFTSGSNYTASLFVKKGNYRYVFINMETSDTSGFLAVFDLDNPSAATQTWALGTGSYVSSKIENEGGGIYRIQVTGAIASGTTAYVVAGFVSAATGNPTTSLEPSWTAAGTEYGYFFGAQLEAGSFATSYIPTAASSVTRAADVVQFTGAALTALQGSAGSFIWETTDWLNQSGGVSIISQTGTPQVYAPTTTSLSFLTGGNSLTATVPNITSNSVRGAISWSASGKSVAANGGTVSTNGTTFAGFAGNAYLGSYSGGAQIDGHMKSFAIYNQRLADGTLQSKSVVGASY